MFDLATEQNRTDRDQRRELGTATKGIGDESYGNCERLDSWAGSEIKSE